MAELEAESTNNLNVDQESNSVEVGSRTTLLSLKCGRWVESPANRANSLLLAGVEDGEDDNKTSEVVASNAATTRTPLRTTGFSCLHAKSVAEASSALLSLKTGHWLESQVEWNNNNSELRDDSVRVGRNVSKN